MKDFEAWKAAAVSQVRFKPDRWSIGEELAAHYEDRVADLERLGFEKELAEQRSLEAMGDPEEVGKALDRVHSPMLGWAWRVSKWLAVAVVTMMLCITWFNGPRTWIGGSWNWLLPFPESGDYQKEDGSTFLGGDTRRIYWANTTQETQWQGMRFRLPYLSVREDPCDPPEDGSVQVDPNREFVQYWLEFVIVEEDLRFWEEGPNLASLDVVMEDSRGIVYRYYGEQDREKGERGFALGWWKKSPFGMSYVAVVNLGPESDEQPEWLDVTFPCEEPWTFRVDLRGAKMR